MKDNCTFNDYNHALNSPEWKERRRVYFLTHPFVCQGCGFKSVKRSGTDIKIHHIVYYKKRHPKDYEDKDLRALCDDCHYTFENRTLQLFRRKAMKYQQQALEIVVQCLPVGPGMLKANPVQILRAALMAAQGKLPLDPTCD